MVKFAKCALIPALMAATIAGSPMAAAFEASTRLVDCKSGDCLLVSGNRMDRLDPVTINGHEVAVEGDARWKVLLPIQTLRSWSAVNARTVTVSVDGEETEARLPTGMFVKPEMLSMLVVKVK